MNSNELQHSIQTLHCATVYVDKSRKAYREIAAGILSTTPCLPAFIADGLEAIVSDVEEQYVTWANTYHVRYSFENDTMNQNWFWAMKCICLDYKKWMV